MASETTSSIYQASTTVDSTQYPASTTFESTQSKACSKQRGDQAKAIWAYTRRGRPDTDEDRKHHYCIPCETENLPFIYHTGVSTNQQNHLKSQHKIIIEEVTEISPIQKKVLDQLRQLYKKVELSGQSTEIDTHIFQRYLDRAVIYEALISLIVVHSLPFRMVEWPEFHTLCRVLNPESQGFLTTSHSCIRKKLGECWVSSKDIIRRKLQSAISSIHISLDIWTSPQGYLLLGIIAHFIERQDENHVKALLALRVVPGHSGEDQFSVLRPVLEDYGITKQLGAIMGDNATTNGTLCRAVESYLLKEEGLEWDASQWRVRCLGHIINLSVQAFLFHKVFTVKELEALDEEEDLGDSEDLPLSSDTEKQMKFRLLGPLGKLHNIVVHIRRSPSRIARFKALAGRLIPLDNRTRWNSWYTMLDVALEKHTQLDTYCKEYLEDLGPDYLIPSEWERLRMIAAFLKLFQRATLETQGDTATIDRVLFTMDVLIQWFNKSLKTYAHDEDFCSRIRKGWEVFDTYYRKSDDTPLYAAALILHPNRRTKYIRANWEKRWVQPTLTKVRKLWEEYRDQLSTPGDSILREEVGQPIQRELDDFDEIAQTLGGYVQAVSQDEWEDYCQNEPLDIGKLSALQWWRQETQRKRYPKLSLMAIDILSIPAMSAEVERIFSGARRTVSWDRTQMTAETLEIVECLKHWKRSGILCAFIDASEGQED